MSVFSDVIRVAGRSPKQVYLGILLRILAQGCAIAPFFLAWLALQWQLDGTGSTSSWLLLAGLLAASLLGQLAFSHYGQLNCFLGAYDLMMGYRAALTDHLRRMPLGFFLRRRVGELATMLTDDVKRVEDIFTHLLAEVVAGISAVVIFVAVLLWIDWRLTLALLIPLPVALLLLIITGRFLLSRTAGQSGRFALASGLLVEFVTGIRTLRLFNRCDAMLKRLDDTFADIRRGSLGVEAWGGGGVQLFRLVTELGLVTLFIAGAWLFAGSGLDAATWLLFVLVAYKIIDPLLEIAAYFTVLGVMKQSASRISSLMAEPALAESSNVAVTTDNTVSFDKVTFRYENEGEWALRDISFNAPAGSVTAIVGPSGSGKSTLLHLLGRFFDPQQGVIRLGGLNISTLGSDRLYEQIGFVFQDVQLFDGSILDNVRIGRPDASDEDVRAVCREAYCSAFIDRLEQGYHTRIGEGGQRLSGGERQRLSIARMLLKNPPVILLDEATASVDPCVQADIQRALSRLAYGRTVLIIAHRLRTVEHAQQIIVLDRGEIVERGNHDALLASGGLYARLWKQQECAEAIETEAETVIGDAV